MALNFGSKQKTFQGERQLIAHTTPKSPITEQYRNIRTNIQFAAVGEQFRTLMFTSANPSEGKTTTTANTAVVFAQQGQKVLLVDADLRKPATHTILREKNVNGLTSVLAGQHPLEKCIRPTLVENLYFLSAGAIPPNPAEMLGSSRMKTLTQEMLEQFDLVIFDTPPVLAVTDAQVLANLCDGIVLVVRSGRTDKDAALKAKNLLQNATGKLLGAILNDKQQKENEHYYYYGN
ncbi:CpsD/CapB family tyrosine-protein kinase [Ectobacillus ponti]|uniref:non-specific protein-tyrosine kinase n=1 Tax=Ectobacillus ponti TaxID=2961894 RepID=A0AA41X2Q4_9BACI|nr:CpsD/CapB family tyrosine-protein kinase [Ectobacillus ponti]MCP8967859.1 CpsD/CapB family tyrosine-protein kinase [Ectobacillus ponti]